jgi:hypothetical protein
MLYLHIFSDVLLYITYIVICNNLQTGHVTQKGRVGALPRWGGGGGAMEFTVIDDT